MLPLSELNAPKTDDFHSVSVVFFIVARTFHTVKLKVRIKVLCFHGVLRCLDCHKKNFGRWKVISFLSIAITGGKRISHIFHEKFVEPFCLTILLSVARFQMKQKSLTIHWNSSTNCFRAVCVALVESIVCLSVYF